MYSMVVVAHGCNTPRVDAMTRRLSILRHRLLRAGDRVGSLGFATLWVSLCFGRVLSYLRLLLLVLMARSRPSLPRHRLLSLLSWWYDTTIICTGTGKLSCSGDGLCTR